jgi:hypothetical protein
VSRRGRGQTAATAKQGTNVAGPSGPQHLQRELVVPPATPAARATRREWFDRRPPAPTPTRVIAPLSQHRRTDMQPLTPADRGQWYDPKFTGQGFEIRVLEDGTHATLFFCGKVAGWFPAAPVWFSVQGKPDANGALPLYLMDKAELGVEHDLSGVQVGTVVFDRKDDKHITATVVVNSDGKTDHFSPVPNPVSATFNLVLLVK